MAAGALEEVHPDMSAKTTRIPAAVRYLRRAEVIRLVFDISDSTYFRFEILDFRF
jgi:hypothetical protein